MGFKDVLKKFGEIALMEAPLILQAAGAPAGLGSIIPVAITAAKGMGDADNAVKAAEAAILTKEILAATNQVLVARGHAPLVDESVSDDALAHAVKLAYDVTKLKAGAVPPTPPV